MKIGIILGTRPEIIKMSPIIRYCESNNLDFFVIHSNQHYSENMDKIFFKDLELSDVNYNLNVGSGSHGKQTGEMLEKIESILLKEKPTHIFVQGDTNTVLAGALAASKINIKIIHIEAGLRSYDNDMPEEVNRVITDRISDYLFCPTIKQQEILFKEGISKDKIFVVGNSIVDAIFENKALSEKKSSILEKLNLQKNEYILLTMHRPSNVDFKKNIQEIFLALKSIYNKFKIKFIFPIHPRTKKNIEHFGIKIPEFIKIIEPVGYLDMIQLMSGSKIIMTDSGGIQEEACILNVPSVTLRENTERPETLDVGASVLVGANTRKIINGFKKMILSDKKWDNPFGNDVTKKIFKVIK